MDLPALRVALLQRKSVPLLYDGNKNGGYVPRFEGTAGEGVRSGGSEEVAQLGGECHGKAGHLLTASEQPANRLEHFKCISELKKFRQCNLMPDDPSMAPAVLLLHCMAAWALSRVKIVGHSRTYHSLLSLTPCGEKLRDNMDNGSPVRDPYKSELWRVIRCMAFSF